MATLGIFDSGIGGLTVLDAISETLPTLSTIYLADQANFPYGTKDPQTLLRCAIKNSGLLISKGAQAILIACHTASALTLEPLTAHFPMPIFGMVEATIKQTLALNPKGPIALLATEATIRAQAYEKLGQSVETIPFALQELINAIESDRVTEELLIESLEEVKSTGADTVILACTHFAHIEQEIAEYLGDEVQLINPARAVAGELKEKLGPLPDAPRSQTFISSGDSRDLLQGKIDVHFFSKNG